MGAPRGATIIKEELNDEAGKKLREVKKANKFEEFIAISKKAEEESIKPLSGDYEILENVDAKQLKKLGDEKRIIGWEPHTDLAPVPGTAMVLKVAFLEKKAKLKKGE